MTVQRITTLIRTGVVLVACLGLPASLSANVLLHYDFNGSGAMATNSGSVAGDTHLWDAAGVGTDLRTPDGGGASGDPGDKAFDNTASTQMGGIGGVAMGYPDSPPVSSALKSLTITGWFRDAGTGANGKIFFTGGALANRTELNWQHPGTLNLLVGDGVSNGNAGSGFATYDSALQINNQDKWVFFAVTYDGDGGTDNINFYIGDELTPVSFVSASTTPITSTVTGNNYAIGNIDVAFWAPNQSGNVFDGKIDNFRLIGSTSDSSGALEMSAIEAIRASDVPEPGTVLLLGLGGVLMVARRR